MEVLGPLVLLAVGFAALGVWVFLRALRSGQFDDLNTPAHRILIDDVVVEQDKDDLKTKD